MISDAEAHLFRARAALEQARAGSKPGGVWVYVPRNEWWRLIDILQPVTKDPRTDQRRE